MMKFNHSSAFNKAAFTLITSLSLVSLAVPYAMAESKTSDIVAEAPVDMDFKKLDLNSDKKLSLKEAVKDKALATSFDATDANKDGAITPDEYASYKAASMQTKTPDGAAPAAVTPVN
jgi:EF hand